MSDWELPSNHGPAPRRDGFPQHEDAEDRIESWRCAACHYQPLDAYRNRFNDACLRCFENRLAAYREQLLFTWSMHEHRQGIVIAMLSLLCWFGASTDACW